MEKIIMSDSESKQLAGTLREVDLFSHLSNSEMELMLPYVTLYKFKKGEKVFKQGTVGDAFYIINRGIVSVSRKEGFFGFSKKLAPLGPGNFFGELALVSHEPRNATAICETESQIFVFRSVDFDTIGRRSPMFAERVRKVAEKRRVKKEPPKSPPAPSKPAKKQSPEVSK